MTDTKAKSFPLTLTHLTGNTKVLSRTDFKSFSAHFFFPPLVVLGRITPDWFYYLSWFQILTEKRFSEPPSLFTSLTTDHVFQEVRNQKKTEPSQEPSTLPAARSSFFRWYFTAWWEVFTLFSCSTNPEGGAAPLRTKNWWVKVTGQLIFYFYLFEEFALKRQTLPPKRKISSRGCRAVCWFSRHFGGKTFKHLRPGHPGFVHKNSLFLF